VIAQTSKLKVSSMAMAKQWLKNAGYAEVKSVWMKGRHHAARIETLATGRVAIIEGVTV